ncbi:metallophosphoesterase family protein [Haladaptatus caseinilyticus]|uniref:metallophosphoesterase family protein n=1 Tax=Haladaptatus caseinilyticus TaxID=2993314 RepID=UPI00224B3ADB|nr:metallophosphoesterase family protein [Haladaptatus caseinilyticus]
MLQVAIISDTHIPTRANRLPDWVRTRIQRADYTIHAGDFDSADALASVGELTDGNLTAVAGNTDPRSLRLPELATRELDGVTFVVTHGTGPKRGYRKRVAKTVRETAGTVENGAVVGVAGHTHRVMDEEIDGVRLLNPGSATGAAPARKATMLVATVEDGSLTVQAHES